MNKARRTKLRKLLDQLDSVRVDLEALKDEETEAQDNMPESLQNTQRYQDMGGAIESIEEAISSIDDAWTAIDSISA